MNIKYTHASMIIKQCMTTNITCVLGTTRYLIISIHNKNKYNGETGRNNFDQEETTTLKSIQDKKQYIIYTCIKNYQAIHDNQDNFYYRYHTLYYNKYTQ